MTTNEPTAAETCAARRADIARLIDVLEMELEKFGQRAAADPKNWGFAGTLYSVRSTLVHAVASLANMEIEEVEMFLADAE